MVPWPVPVIIVGSVALLALLLNIRQAVVMRKLKGEMANMRLHLEELKGVKEEKSNFSSALNEVERNTVAPHEGSGRQSEKYRYVASLTEQGVDAKEIAAALQMAPAEVEQLMQLARLKQATKAAKH